MNLCQLSTLNFNGKIYATEPTSEIIGHITSDGIKIHESNVKYLNKGKNNGKFIPYMSQKTRSDILSLVHGYGYNKWIDIEDGIRFKFISNGHITGSASIIIEVKDGYDKETIYVSGDTSGARKIPFSKKLDMLNKKYSFNHLILESTYSVNYVPQKLEYDMIEQLYKMIKDTCVFRNKRIIIPSFSLARSTNILYYLKKTYEKYPELYKVPIYGISPLMTKCHTTIGKYVDFYDEEWKDEVDLFTWNRIKMISEGKDMRRISNSKEACVIVSSAGMGCDGMNALLLPSVAKTKGNLIAFVGYLANGTSGHSLVHDKQKKLTSTVDGKSFTVPVKAKVINISGLSSHCSGQEIITELKHTEKKKVKNIILVHGDKERCESFKDLLYEYYDKNKVDIHIPRKHQIIKLT